MADIHNNTSDSDSPNNQVSYRYVVKSKEASQESLWIDQRSKIHPRQTWHQTHDDVTSIPYIHMKSRYPCVRMDFRQVVPISMIGIEIKLVFREVLGE